MVRRIAKVDANQRDIVDALKKIGCSVTSLHTVGSGCPDLLVGYRGINHLLEVKNVRGRNKHTDLQKDWFAQWKGAAPVTVRNPEEAILAVSGPAHGSADS